MRATRWLLGAPLALLAGLLGALALICGHAAAVVAGDYGPRPELADIGDGADPWVDEMRASWLAEGPSA